MLPGARARCPSARSIDASCGAASPATLEDVTIKAFHYPSPVGNVWECRRVGSAGLCRPCGVSGLADALYRQVRLLAGPKNPLRKLSRRHSQTISEGPGPRLRPCSVDIRTISCAKPIGIAPRRELEIRHFRTPINPKVLPRGERRDLFFRYFFVFGLAAAGHGWGGAEEFEGGGR